MKTEVTFREQSASIIITAETRFEKDLLGGAYSKFKDQELNINIEQETYGPSIKEANVVIVLTNPKE